MDRAKGKFNADYSIVDAHKLFCKTYFDIDKTLYREIVSEINAEMMRLAVEDAIRLHLPNAGYLSVVKYRPKVLDEEGRLMTERLKLDYQACWKLWHEQYPGKTRAEISKIKDKELVYITNLHTDGYRMHFNWDKDSIRLKCKSGYMFKPSRDNSRSIKTAIENGADYFEKIKL
ncbi:MAG TPA: hypothetical protein DCY51_01740 [Bacteroidetes bacterium]|nr:hypothetical protein [Bacteroidota bacterium]